MTVLPRGRRVGGVSPPEQQTSMRRCSSFKEAVRSRVSRGQRASLGRRDGRRTAARVFLSNALGKSGTSLGLEEVSFCGLARLQRIYGSCGVDDGGLKNCDARERRPSFRVWRVMLVMTFGVIVPRSQASGSFWVLRPKPGAEPRQAFRDWAGLTLDPARRLRVATSRIPNSIDSP